jgi:hypothetical protein
MNVHQSHVAPWPGPASPEIRRTDRVAHGNCAEKPGSVTDSLYESLSPVRQMS